MSSQSGCSKVTCLNVEFPLDKVRETEPSTQNKSYERDACSDQGNLFFWHLVKG